MKNEAAVLISSKSHILHVIEAASHDEIEEKQYTHEIA
jgi:hypothetical protein